MDFIVYIIKKYNVVTRFIECLWYVFLGVCLTGFLGILIECFVWYVENPTENKETNEKIWTWMGNIAMIISGMGALYLVFETFRIVITDIRNWFKKEYKEYRKKDLTVLLITPLMSKKEDFIF